MRNRIQMALLLAGLLLVSGCGLVGPYEMRGEYMLTLDQALRRASDVYDLWALWEQAPSGDRVIIEKEILNDSSKTADLYTLQKLQQKASSQEIRDAAAQALREHEQAREEKAKREREEHKARVQKDAEEIRLALKEARKRLIAKAGGKLDDKSAEEVERLVDEWKWIGRAVGENLFGGSAWYQESPQFFAPSYFYAVFGQPLRKQFVGDDGISSSSRCYYFYYQCRDGTVQMRIDGQLSGDNPRVFVLDLNIL